jgi:hypothetical protein
MTNEWDAAEKRNPQSLRRVSPWQVGDLPYFRKSSGLWSRA